MQHDTPTHAIYAINIQISPKYVYSIKEWNIFLHFLFFDILIFSCTQILFGLYVLMSPLSSLVNNS
jgi:hypothetical protein